MKQYMPKKPIKRGIKVWVHADSANGYFSDFEIYTGASTTPEKGLGAGVVKRLTANLEGKHHQVFCDNFFCGIDLFSELLDDGVYACGTLRTNHLHFPPELKPLTKKGLKKRGDSEVRQAGNLVLSIWQDNKAVTVLSTNAQSTTTVMVKRRQKDGTRVDVQCPESVALYNKYMGGVTKEINFVNTIAFGLNPRRCTSTSSGFSLMSLSRMPSSSTSSHLRLVLSLYHSKNFVPSLQGN